MLFIQNLTVKNCRRVGLEPTTPPNLDCSCRLSYLRPFVFPSTNGAPIDGCTGLSAANQQTFHKCSLDTCTLLQKPTRTPKHKPCETYMSRIVQVNYVIPASGAGQELSHREGTERSIQLVGIFTQMRKESNLQPTVLETVALPIELRT